MWLLYNTHLFLIFLLKCIIILVAIKNKLKFGGLFCIMYVNIVYYDIIDDV